MAPLPTVHLRSEWTPRPVPNGPPQKDVGAAFVHHEGGAVRGNMTLDQEAAALREIEAGVLRKGYTSIDYNLMAFQSGRVWEGRGWGHEDAATKGWNQKSVSICAVGNFQLQQPSDALIQALGGGIRLASLGDWLVDAPSIKGHRDTYSTACPGNNLYARMNDIRAAFAQAGTAPQPAQEDSVEHGMAVDAVFNPKIPTQGYTLDRWGGVHPFGGAVAAIGGPYWSGLDVARRLIITDWVAGKGYVMDLNGALHGFGGAPVVTASGYWKGGVIVPMAEL